MASVLPLAGGITAHLFLLDTSINKVDNLGITGPHTTEAVHAYTHYYGQFDPRGQYAAKQRVGTLVRCQEICDAHYVRRSEIYQDFLIPNGLRFTIVGNAAKRDAISAVIGIMRPTELGEFTEMERIRSKIIMRYFGNAVRLHWHMQGLERKIFAQAQALDALSFGVMVCNGQGLVHHANHEAEGILRRMTAIRMIQGRLRCGLALDQTRLDHLLRSVTKNGDGNGMRVRDTATQQEWHLWSVPARDGLGFASEPLAVLVIINPNRPATLDSILQSAFNFTPTEVRLVSALAAGVTLTEYAQQQRISIATARTHVRAVLSKAGVKRQTDLIRIVAGAGLVVVRNAM